MKEQNYLFTFGYGQAHPNKFVRIFGTYDSARTEMIRRYGNKWAFQYSEKREEELKTCSITELKE